jgi:endonuclease YncB( thermonuclease family)
MKSTAKISMCLVLTLLLFANQARASFQAHVVEVVNNYTIKVLADDEVKVVRLAEVISPSVKFGSFPCAEEAKRFLREISSGKEVTIFFWVTDTVGRSVCEVFLPDGSSLGDLMVSKGYLVQDKYYSSRTDLSYLEKIAKKNRVGVWKYIDQIL